MNELGNPVGVFSAHAEVVPDWVVDFPTLGEYSPRTRR